VLFNIKRFLQYSTLVIFCVYVFVSFWGVFGGDSVFFQSFSQVGLYPQAPVFTLQPGISPSAIRQVCIRIDGKNQSHLNATEWKLGCEPKMSWLDFQISYLLVYPWIRNIKDISAFKVPFTQALHSVLNKGCENHKDGDASLQYRIQFRSFDNPVRDFVLDTSAVEDCENGKAIWQDLKVSEASVL
jgi:hypothetical protein